MKRTLLLAAVAAATATLTIPAQADSPVADICQVLADDGAKIMGARQRGDTRQGAIRLTDWNKYEDTQFEGLETQFTMVELAWDEPIHRTSAERQESVGEFAHDIFIGCSEGVGLPTAG